MRVVSILLVSGLALLYCQVAALPHPQEDEEEVEDETEEKEENDVGELNLDSENFNDVGKLNLCTFVETIYWLFKDSFISLLNGCLNFWKIQRFE